jgi:putative flippase GtrA
MALPAAEAFDRVRRMLPELLKFGVVGGLGSVIDLGGAAVLHSKYHVGPLEAKALSTAAATVLTYLGSRFWTFRDRENQELKREAVLFIVLNLVGLLIAEVVVGFVTYIMGMRGQLEYNAASVLGTGLATIFRYCAYKKWVFLAPAEQSGLKSTSDPELARFPDYPPWELDPAYLVPAGATAVSPARASAVSPARASAVSPARASAVSPARASAVGSAAAPAYSSWDPASTAPLSRDQPTDDFLSQNQPTVAFRQVPLEGPISSNERVASPLSPTSSAAWPDSRKTQPLSAYPLPDSHGQLPNRTPGRHRRQ